MLSTCRKRIMAGLLLTGLILLPAGARAQHAELSGGSGVSASRWDATFTSRYSPPMESIEHQSAAGQDVLLDPGRAAVVWVSFGWLSTGGIGIETRVDYRRPSLRGVNGPYDVSLRYVSRPPPGYEPVEVNIDRSIAWPDTTGHVWQATSSISVMARLGRRDRANVRLLIGGGVTRLGGRFEPVGYSSYRLGGHSCSSMSSAARRCTCGRHTHSA